MQVFFSANIAIELHQFTILNIDSDIFKFIFKTFVLFKDYDSTCFKIVNRKYLNYITAKKNKKPISKYLSLCWKNICLRNIQILNLVFIFQEELLTNKPLVS